MHSFYAIVPAAGSGSRMGGGLPKQYLPLLGRPLLWHCLNTLAGVSRIQRVALVLSPDDAHWRDAAADMAGLRGLQPVFTGGATRADSVKAGLAALRDVANEGDWVLVHDAARACLSVAQVECLIDTLADDPVGGLLAVPVADTLKRADTGSRVVATVPREAMWQAQTPQMFRYGLLCEALERFPAVTDEAGAVEAMGLSPRLVAADATNFKVTYPQDLALAAQILQARRDAAGD
ncbi:2-C-methyl-D-erythritol 4-phosphate cytidylyltransferase [Uliginosibacterium sp. H1]|uniref:2-C-methyl-D-erythritol 4-phosphate cytidylyltransferase n=1 Tax=Uliginosibacterium sp. H1 TaxID=3114757 RepID=UPI002E189FE8|nr:2-C-methyl-D-erythritol 4-phosphate cytidylyltransferase [Uliginosibacterium sp. H1]